MKTAVSLLCAASVALASTTALAQRACVEGITVHDGTFDANTIEELARFGATCVRVRLRRDRWTGLDDEARLGTPPRTLWETWDALLDLYQQRGIEVFLEVGADAMGRRPHELRDATVRAAYASLFARVVRRYVRTIKVFELPDRWDEAPPAGVSGETALSPEDVAQLTLDARAAAMRAAEGDLCNRFEVLLGGMRYNQSPGDPGTLSRYLTAVYTAGVGPEGRGPGLWDAWQTREHALPFDGIAVRSFPAWNPLLTASDQGAQAASGAASAAGGVVQRFEGGLAARAVWITEAGFASDGTTTQNTRQRDWMMSFFRESARDDLSTPIRTAVWYAFIDPPWEAPGWGVFGEDLMRPAVNVLYNELRHTRPMLGANIVWTVPVLRLRPSERRVVEARVTNLGPDDNGRGTIPAGERVRVCAAPGCPTAEDVNQVPWTEPPPRGNGDPSTTGACVEFRLTRDWWPSVSELFRWEITAPAAPGRYVLAARMRTVGGLWYGRGNPAVVEVTAPDASTQTDASELVDTDLIDAAPLDAMPRDVSASSDVTVARDAATRMDTGPAPSPSPGCACEAATGGARDLRPLAFGLLAIACSVQRNRRRR